MLSLFDNLLSPPKPAPRQETPLQQEFEIAVKGENIPVRVLVENRYNNRVTVNKNGILIRIAGRQSRDEQRKHLDTLLKWAKEKLDDKPHLLESLPQRKYMNGEILQVGNQEFVISIFRNEAKKSSAKIFNNNIVLSVARGLNKEAEENVCTYLVAKCLCKFYHPKIEERLHELNAQFFKKELKSVKMKYATSFWGHCSFDGHIVISARLMFAPERVIDYVLIHELAHLVHHNHSLRFWKVVKQAMPDYMQAERHLRDYSNKYYL